MTSGTPWTPWDDAVLVRNWTDGYPVRLIAEALGRTENSVIGRAHRMGLPEHPLCNRTLPKDLGDDYAAYRRGDMTIADIADKHGVGLRTIYGRMVQDGEPRRSLEIRRQRTKETA